MPFLKLFRRFILRALMREKARSAVATIGIALGVAVVVAIRLANSSVVDTFRAAIDSVSGNASLRIRGETGRFDELRFPELDWIRRDGRLSPVIETYAMILDEDQVGPIGAEMATNHAPRGELLHVLGVDILMDFGIRDYQVLKTGRGEMRSAREVLDLLRDSNSVILTERFMRKRGLRVGDSILLAFGSTPGRYTVRGVLLNRGPGRTLDGNFALMDIAAAQLAADRLGTLDYVDVMLDDDVDPAELLTRIQKGLPAGLVAEYPDASSRRCSTMIAAFQFNLSALSAVALIVGLFLIYNTVAISVAARRDEIGMLRAVGARRRTVLALFLGEACLLALIGLVLGLPLGRLLASYAVTGTAQTVETFYIAGIAEASASQLRLAPIDILGMTLCVIPLAMLAAFLPAWEASSVEPIEALRGRGPLVSRWRPGKVMAAGLLCVGIGWVFTRFDPVNDTPLFGFLAELFFMIGGALFTPILLWSVCQFSSRVVSRYLPYGRTEMRLASANLLSTLSRVSVSVAALGVSLSMMVAITVMVGSFRETVVYWLDSVLSADLAIKPVMQSSSVMESRLSRRALETIEQSPDVRGTVSFSSRQIPYGDKTIRVVVTDLAKSIHHGRLLFKQPPIADESFAGGLRDSVLVSESFALRYDAESGDEIKLPTDEGSALLRVGGVYFDYASNQGTVMLDLATYRQLFRSSDPDPGPQHLSVYLKPDRDPLVVRQRLIERLGPDEFVYCVTNSEVRSEALRIFESTFTVTYALQLIAVIVAGLGVASTLITLIYQRQREIGLLSLIGATVKQTKRVILIEAVLLGAVSQIVGIGIGILLAYVLIYVINVQSFGWTIQFHLPIAFLLTSSLCVLIASGMFGMYPAIRAASVNALQTVREE